MKLSPFIHRSMKESSSRDHMVAIKTSEDTSSVNGECRTILLSLLQDRNGFIVSPSECNEVRWIYDGGARTVKVNLDSE